MALRRKPSAKSNIITRFFDFLLKYWIIFTSIITGLFALYQYLSKSHVNQEVVDKIRINYSQLLDLSSRIVARVEQNKNIDSLSMEFEIAYGKFTPLENDTTVFKYVRDFRLELRDFRKDRSNVEKLTFRQRCLLQSISKEIKQL